MAPYRAKKRLGQNFLISQNIIDRIVKTIDPRKNETIIEIGPGRGGLTLPLAESQSKLIAVEFDRDLIGYLEKLLENFPDVSIINDDFLKYNPPASKFKLVGNLPYNISSPVFDWVVTHHKQITEAFLMVQKEVANRVASQPGSKDWSPLAIMTQLYFDIKPVFDISSEHFRPAPKVNSTLIKLVPKKKPDIKNLEYLKKLVAQSFHHRRKTLLNNLIPAIIPDSKTALRIYAQVGLTPKCRAEQIPTETFLKLTEAVISGKLN